MELLTIISAGEHVCGDRLITEGQCLNRCLVILVWDPNTAIGGQDIYPLVNTLASTNHYINGKFLALGATL